MFGGRGLDSVRRRNTMMQGHTTKDYKVRDTNIAYFTRSSVRAQPLGLIYGDAERRASRVAWRGVSRRV